MVVLKFKINVGSYRLMISQKDYMKGFIGGGEKVTNHYLQNILHEIMSVSHEKKIHECNWLILVNDQNLNESQLSKMLTCSCHKIHMVEAVDLQDSNHSLKLRFCASLSLN